MATIIVEDGTGSNPAANSYVSEAELSTYATDRGVTLTGTASVLIIQAMDYIESLNYIGYKFDEDQPLQWPRQDVYIDGYYVAPEDIPKELKNGLMAACVVIDEGNDPLAAIERATKKEKLDVMEVEYMDNAASETLTRTINASLKKLIDPGGSGSNFNVWRGL